MIRHLLTYGLVLLFTCSSQAYLSTMDTGDILPAGKYRALGNLQYLGDPSGLNLNAGFDAGVNESSNIRVVAGFGSVTFHTGLFFKWIPFPDTDEQPAVGVMAGGTWARYDGENYPGLRIHPLVSKQIQTEIGLLTPYASLPFGVISAPRKNIFPLQLTVGTDWKPNEVDDFSFLLEMGLNLNESSSYITAGLLYYLPE